MVFYVSMKIDTEIGKDQACFEASGSFFSFFSFSKKARLGSREVNNRKIWAAKPEIEGKSAPGAFYKQVVLVHYVSPLSSGRNRRNKT